MQKTQTQVKLDFNYISTCQISIHLTRTIRVLRNKRKNTCRSLKAYRVSYLRKILHSTYNAYLLKKELSINNTKKERN